MTFEKLVDSIKSATKVILPKVLLCTSFLCIGLASYTYGLFEAQSRQQLPLVIEHRRNGVVALNNQVLQEAGDVHASCPFLASINGSRYYPKGCSASNRINKENIICFDSQDIALSKGYTRTTACN